MEPTLKVNYSNGSNLTPNQQLMFKNLEWGINLETSTMYLSYEIDQDQLYVVMTRFDNFVRINPKQDINLNITSYGGDVYHVRNDRLFQILTCKSQHTLCWCLYVFLVILVWNW